MTLAPASASGLQLPPGSPKIRSRDAVAMASRAPSARTSGPCSTPRPSSATVTTGYAWSGPPSSSPMSGRITSRPAYVPQVGQTRCGRRGLWQRGQRFVRGLAAVCVARRLSRRVREVLFLGRPCEPRMVAGIVPSPSARGALPSGGRARDSWTCSPSGMSLSGIPHSGQRPLQSGRQRSATGRARAIASCAHDGDVELVAARRRGLRAPRRPYRAGPPPATRPPLRTSTGVRQRMQRP